MKPKFVAFEKCPCCSAVYFFIIHFDGLVYGTWGATSRSNAFFLLNLHREGMSDQDYNYFGREIAKSALPEFDLSAESAINLRDAHVSNPEIINAFSQQIALLHMPSMKA